MASRSQCPASPARPQPLRFCQVLAQSSKCWGSPPPQESLQDQILPPTGPSGLEGGRGLNVEEETKEGTQQP